MVLKKYGYFVSYWKVQDGRRKAIVKVFGEWRELYNLLPKWMSILERINPGTIIDWKLNECEVMIDLPCSKYWRLKVFENLSCFLSFGLVIEGFKHYRPLLHNDRTHLYGKYEEKLLHLIPKLTYTTRWRRAAWTFHTYQTA